MEISKNPSSGRFEFKDIEEKEVRKGKEISGIYGFHGTFENFIGRVLAFFNKTVAVEGNDGTYFFNCESLKHWFDRVGVQGKLEVHNPKWVQQTIDGIIQKKIEANEELHEAIRKGQEWRCAPIIRNGISVNGRNAEGELPLEQAIKKGNSDIVRKLVQLGANVKLQPSKASGSATLLEFVEKTIPSENKATFLFFLDPKNQQALKHVLEQEEQQQKLDKEKQEKQEKERNLRQDFNQALRGGNLGELKSDKYKDLKIEVEPYGSHPLSVTLEGTQNLKENRFAVADYLVAKNPGLINQTDYRKISPLQTAISQFDVDGVKWLISKGADPTLKSSENKSLFEYAKDLFAHQFTPMTEIQKDILMLLAPNEVEKKSVEASYLEKKKNIDQKKELDKQKAEILQTIQADDVEGFKLLIDKGYDPSLYGEFLYDIIHSSKEKSLEILNFFLKKASPERLNQEIFNFLPLEWAIRKRDPKKVELLIQNGARTDLKTSDGLTFDQFVDDQKNPYKTEENKKEWDQIQKAIQALFKSQEYGQVPKNEEGADLGQVKPVQKELEKPEEEIKPQPQVQPQKPDLAQQRRDFIYAQNLEEAKEVINQGIDPSLMVEFLKTSISSDKPFSSEVLNLLLEKATPEQVNGLYMNHPLIEWAVIKHDSKKVKALLDKGANTKFKIFMYGSLYDFAVARERKDQNVVEWNQNHQEILELLKP